MRLLWTALAVGLAGCQCGGGAALRVEVTAEEAAPTLCVTIASAQTEQRSDPIDFTDRRAVLAVYPTDTLTGAVTITARAYAGTTCTGIPALESDPVQARFPERGIESVAVVVAPLPPCDDCADARCAGRPCDDGNACTLGEVCGDGVCGGGEARTCTTTTECRESTCDPASGCTEVITPGATCSTVTNGICLANGTCAQAEANCANGTDDDGDGLSDCEDTDCVSRTCRDKADTCDLAETCVAGQTTCPADTLADTTVVCRDAAGPCDAAERCTGASAACPADAFDSTTVCRAARGDCDTAEQCTGASADCPADTFAPPTTVCRAAEGLCDVAETCTGSAAQCPTDAVAATTTLCRASAGTCDLEERCDGASKACPNDALATSMTVCRAANGECDQAEYCSGASATCSGDTYQPEGTACGPFAGGYTCNGAGSCVADFALDPTNWDPADVPSRSGTYVISNGCNVIFDTSPGASNLAWCGSQPAPDVHPITQPAGPEAALIAFDGLTIEQGGTLTVIGTRPLIVAVYGDATVSGTVDASANGASAGPGSMATNANGLCSTGEGGQGGNAASNLTNTGYGGGGGGGGGGGFATAARAGGLGSNKGANSTGHPGAAGNAGALSGADTLEPLRAGCAGGKGGNGDGGSAPERAGGAAGGAGGAVQLSVARELQITGTGRLLAVGGGGRDAPGYNGGGGGGGSGGALLLEAESLQISSGAILTVTGGGGGEGAGEGDNNLPGDDGGLTTGGLGGDSDNGKSGPGGNGGKDAVTLPVQGGSASNSVFAGGGGGGGAAGRIRLNGVTCTSQGTYSGTVRVDGGCV